MYLCQICKKEGLQAATIVYPFKTRNMVCKVNDLAKTKKRFKARVQAMVSTPSVRHSTKVK